MGAEWLFCFESAGANLGTLPLLSLPTGPQADPSVAPSLHAGLSRHRRALVVAISPA